MLINLEHFASSLKARIFFGSLENAAKPDAGRNIRFGGIAGSHKKT